MQTVFAEKFPNDTCGAGVTGKATAVAETEADPLPPTPPGGPGSSRYVAERCGLMGAVGRPASPFYRFSAKGFFGELVSLIMTKRGRPFPYQK